MKYTQHTLCDIFDQCFFTVYSANTHTQAHRGNIFSNKLMIIIYCRQQYQYATDTHNRHQQ